MDSQSNISEKQYKKVLDSIDNKTDLDELLSRFKKLETEFDSYITPPKTDNSVEKETIMESEKNADIPVENSGTTVDTIKGYVEHFAEEHPYATIGIITLALSLIGMNVAEGVIARGVYKGELRAFNKLYKIVTK